MSFGDRLIKTRKEHGYTREALAQELGISKFTLRNYELEATEPGHTFLKLISDFFNVSVDYLMELTDEKEVLHTFRLRSSEQNMIEQYRTLDPHGKDMVDTVLEKEVDRIKELKASQATVMELSGEPSSKCILAYYGKIAAAGKSYEFNDVMAGTIECPLTKESQRADYAIGVSGDSMEPTFYDGDIVYVKKDVRPETGDIGIFQKDNGIYIKEVGENELISHNTKYKAITDDGDIVCLGKVIGKVEA